MLRPFRRLVLVAAIFGLAVIASNPRQSQSADEPKENARDSGRESHDSLEVRILRASAKIAKIELQKALDSNKQVASTVPDSEVDRLEKTYHLAQQKLDQAKRGDGADPATDRIRQSQANAQIYEDNLNKALAANKRSPNTVPALEVERLRAFAELGKLQVERDKSTAGPDASFSELQQEVRALRKQVADLKTRLDRLDPDSSSATSNK